jgi:tryptophanyl-tRNA synthetase
LFELINEQIREPREIYNQLLVDTAYMEKILKQGAERAREIASPFIAELKKAVGIYSL